MIPLEGAVAWEFLAYFGRAQAKIVKTMMHGWYYSYVESVTRQRHDRVQTERLLNKQFFSKSLKDEFCMVKSQWKISRPDLN